MNIFFLPFDTTNTGLPACLPTWLVLWPHNVGPDRGPVSHSSLFACRDVKAVLLATQHRATHCVTSGVRCSHRHCLPLTTYGRHYANKRPYLDCIAYCCSDDAATAVTAAAAQYCCLTHFVYPADAEKTICIPQPEHNYPQSMKYCIWKR